MLGVFALSLVYTGPAHAVSQFARKYDMACQGCHTAFPRLNYFGEQFRRNGYQMPGSQDGDETKKQVGDSNLFIDELGNLFGIRISLDAFRFETNRLTTNGSPKPRFSIGNPRWIQLFTAGSIFKDTSIIVETEVDNANGVHFNWFTLGYHNLFDSTLLNVQVGKLSVLENFSQSGRLRMIPSVNVQGMSGFTSGGGFASGAGLTHDDAVTIASPQPAINIYGYKGPIVYSVGVTNGSSLADTNKYKNFFGTLRAELQEGDFAGSNVAGWGYLGWDTANNATARITDRFWRTAGGANLRWKGLDVIGAFVYGKDNNWTLTAGGANQTIKAITGQAGYLISERWFAALQYDWVRGTSNVNNFNKVTPVLTFMPRQNMRLDLGGRVDLRNTAGGRQHEVFTNIRSMF